MGATSSVGRRPFRQFNNSSFNEEESLPKLLVLGCMESGKTTFCRQFGRRDSPFHNEYYIHTVQHNLYLMYRSLELQCQECSIDYNEYQADFDVLADYRHREELSEKVKSSMHRLHQAKLMEACQTKNRHMPSMPHNFQYWIQSTDRMLDMNFLPTDQDIIFSYAPTIGCAEYTIRCGGPDRFKYVNVVELPGHHVFRRYWPEYFKNTVALVFIVDLTELCHPAFYDGYLKNKTLSLFKDLLPSPYLKEAGLIILFNKKDLFDERAVGMKWEKLAQHVQTSADALSFYRSQFLTLLPKNRSFHHITNLTGNVNVISLMQDTLNRIIKHNKENLKPL